MDWLLTLAFCAGIGACMYGIYQQARHVGFSEGAGFVLHLVKERHIAFDGGEMVLLDDEGKEMSRMPVEKVSFDYGRKI